MGHPAGELKKTTSLVSAINRDEAIELSTDNEHEQLTQGYTELSTKTKSL